MTYNSKIRGCSTGRYRPGQVLCRACGEWMIRIPGGFAAEAGQVVEVAIEDPGCPRLLVRRRQRVRAVVRRAWNRGGTGVLAVRLSQAPRRSRAA